MLSASVSDSELDKLVFCSRCDETIINTKRNFYKIINKDLIIYQICFPHDDYLCSEHINEKRCQELYSNDIINNVSQYLENDKICNTCLEKLRPYIHYFTDNPKMYMILPYNFDGAPFIDSSSDSDSNYSIEEHNDVFQTDEEHQES